ncbi:MAG: 16S rRNA processing protein RimM [Ruminococcaceae bacterium]|nr:16S rRNA processing protein RimM [Oscillospiraceae bacterium]
MSQEQYLECGRIINTHGVRGACKIESWCDTPEVLCDLPRMFYKKKDEFIELTVTKASVHKGCGLVYFYGIDSIEAAQLLKNRVVYADRDDIELSDDRVFVADIIGLPVFDERTGMKLGELCDLIENPASDLFCVKTEDGREVLVPAVEEFIGHIDDDGVYLCPIPGMFDDGGEIIADDEKDEQ